MCAADCRFAKTAVYDSDVAEFVAERCKERSDYVNMFALPPLAALPARHRASDAGLV
eukprot:CAMPEP_0177531638 /NCGR_PEP_ID=MMETSP0369-20130122/54149_1 /TAXON_ID=447022 ORGANISM="Scrippsiella hangoei-like, Strain SHHI-4" /NCGR_SAMPLE_ID=MMETSP0369 /ASSEMBLY_ACC=CAM_ASM_000364 /LENGTH=56 /DNA_ID=CAMNT_0019012793 /DNA_START=165 /DNA_END=335 /DNA_ORIENTATION=+